MIQTDLRYFSKLHQAYFSSTCAENPLPYWIRFHKGAWGEKQFYDCDVEPISYLNVEIPVYHMFGDVLISSRTLAAIVGSVLPWGGEDSAAEAYSAHRDGCLRRFNEWLEKHPPENDLQKKTLELFRGYPRTHHTIVNRAATHRTHHNIQQHVRHFFGRGLNGIHFVDKLMKGKMLDKLEYDDSPDKPAPVTRYFLENDFRERTHLLNKKACLSVVRRYVAYNHAKDPKYVKLFMHHVGKFLGADPVKKSKLRRVLIAVEYSPYEFRKEFADSIPKVTQDPAIIEAVVVGDVMNHLRSVPWVKSASLESFYDPADRIEFRDTNKHLEELSDG
jgi:hypothetical protein